MNVALERVCGKTPYGERHYVRKRVAKAIVQCAESGKKTAILKAKTNSATRGMDVKKRQTVRTGLSRSKRTKDVRQRAVVEPLVDGSELSAASSHLFRRSVILPDQIHRFPSRFSLIVRPRQRSNEKCRDLPCLAM